MISAITLSDLTRERQRQRVEKQKKKTISSSFRANSLAFPSRSGHGKVGNCVSARATLLSSSTYAFIFANRGNSSERYAAREREVFLQNTKARILIPGSTEQISRSIQTNTGISVFSSCLALTALFKKVSLHRKYFAFRSINRYHPPPQDSLCNCYRA